MIASSQPHLTVRWNDQARCVVMEWRSAAEGEASRRGLDAGLELLAARRASGWLADLRNLGHVTVADQQWANEVWFPRAIRAGLR